MSCNLLQQKKYGPGYRSPLDAINNSKPEKLLYVTCVKADEKCPDYLATIDVDENSLNYGKIINRTYMTNIGDELHHSGWNTCSSCFNDYKKIRNKLILPCLRSNRIYIIDINDNVNDIKIHKIINENELFKFNVSAPHTTHCLPSGDIMISCMGDRNGNNSNLFLLLNSNFEPYKIWNQQNQLNNDNNNEKNYNYDFWYQPMYNILISTEWTSPNIFRKGFFNSLKNLNNNNNDNENFINNNYGHCLNIWEFNTGKLLKKIDLRSMGNDACMPLEIRFLHSPSSKYGFVACAYSSNVFRFNFDFDNNNNNNNNNELLFNFNEVIKLNNKQINNDGGENFIGGNSIPALITDIIISMDDKYLFLSAWLFSEIRQYTNLLDNVILLNRIRIGGLLLNYNNIKIINDDEPFLNNDNNNNNNNNNEYKTINNKYIRGGVQMLQLSLDGKRLYCTNSLYSQWDKEFYPDSYYNGSQLFKINIDNNEQRMMKLDENFLIDFGDEPNGPALAHEMRYPNGDCTSDIFV